uniref:C-type lectin domain-containing protein n=1 Tax=Oryzias latipes TaxID=8090 RepID=A0A3P9MD85_ORYLA
PEKENSKFTSRSSFQSSPLVLSSESWQQEPMFFRKIQASEISFLRMVAGSLRDRVRSSVTRRELGVEPLLLHIRRRKPRCPAGWIRFGSSCYFFSGESKSWDKARESCRTTEADLVVINSTDEKVDQPVWIGLTDKVQEGTWKWVDGSPLTLNQRYGEEDCAEIRETPGFWNDISCETSLRWICEKEATLFV